MIIGFDRHSVRHADRKIAYVAGTRGTEYIKIFCENKLELWDIEKRKGDRKSVTEMLTENPREQQSQNRIKSIIDSLHDFLERVQNQLLNMTKDKEPEIEMKMEMENHQEFGMSM